ncbi:hypothetical protein LTR28_006452 [Elasticomyces elasticus]|nr:hypothetical protein LTR28_006452 [Elasticomyces elasticus]
MATSPTSTVPDEISDVFAELIPSNTNACIAFSHVVSQIRADELGHSHHAKFVSFDSSSKHPLSHALAAPTVPTASPSPLSHDYYITSTTDDESKPNSDAIREQEQVWVGRYRLCFVEPINVSKASWRIGAGRHKVGEPPRPFRGVDIWLVTTLDAKLYNVRGMHALLSFSTESGVLQLQAIHPGDSRTKVDQVSFARPKTQALNRRVCSVWFGNLEYTLAYTTKPGTFEDQLLQEQKSFFFQNMLDRTLPPPLTSGTPSDTDIILGDWTLRAITGQGAFGTVSAAVHQDTSVAAVKTLIRKNRSTATSIAKEVQILRRLRPLLETEDVNKRVVRFVEVIYQSNSETYHSGAENVWLLIKPLAFEGTFERLMQLDRSIGMGISERIDLLQQVLQGLDCLHRLGWVHRDIKPQNLGLVSLSPPRAIVLDIGSAFEIGHATGAAIKPTPGCFGTLGYLAPEMEWQSYNTAVDVWALGVVAFQLLQGEPLFTQHCVNIWKKDYDQMQDCLKVRREHGERLSTLRKNAETGAWRTLVARMLHVDADKRVKAVVALQDALFESLAVNENDDGIPIPRKIARTST